MKLMGVEGIPDGSIMSLTWAPRMSMPCTPRKALVKKTPTRKEFLKIRKLKRISPTRKHLIGQGTSVNPKLL